MTTPRLWARASTAVLLMSVAACGGGGGTSPEPTNTASSTDQANTASSTARAVSGGESVTYLLTEAELPDGWRPASGEQHLGVPTACGVVLEPSQLSSAKTKRYTQGFSGPFIIQYSFVADDVASAMGSADALAEKSATCRSFEASGKTIEVSALDGVDPVGEGFSALVLNDASRGDLSTQHWVTFRDGRHVTVLVAYGYEVASANVLTEFAQKIHDKESA